MKKKSYYNISLLISSVLFCWAIGEIAIRSLGHYDSEGNFYFLSRKLKPYKLPVISVEKKIEAYLSSDSSFIAYDPVLGWSPRPNSKSANGLEYYNSDCMRTISADFVISRIPKAGILRIAIFGDSFTRGDDVPFENTWGYYLEKNLKNAGIDAEVLNFGVGAYGLDQAFLRWQKQGSKFSPHIIILGINSETINRNVNVLRPINCPNTGIPFSKPRYIIEGDKLKLLNAPAIEPEKVTGIMKNIESWELARYEYWLNPKDYQKRIWLKSKFVSSVVYAVDRIKQKMISGKDREDFYSIEKEPAQLTLKIVKEFKNDAESKGARFFVVHLPIPDRRYKNMILTGDKIPYREILDEINKFTPAIRPENIMVQKLPSDIPAIAHYSETENGIVAQVISEFIRIHGHYLIKGR